jgi:hypothetical protein
MIKSFFLFVVFCSLIGCHTAQPAAQTNDANPPAAGFDLTGSDEKAIAIADEVMKAMGGKKSWDNTRYLTWNFFGRRILLWDKKTGNVRIEIPAEKTEIYFNINDSQTGRIVRNSTIETHPDTITKYISQGKSIWINDSYWLVMPFKLKDSGVTLKYIGKGTTADGIAADVLQLTFQKVGDTPQNKYLVYVDENDHLVKQWDYFKDAADSKPGFSSPWLDYKTYGTILLSGNRGVRQLTAINVYTTLPNELKNLYLFKE